MILKLFKTRSTFQLSRYFSIASLITIIVAALVLSWMYRVLAVDDLIQQGEKHHVTLTQTFSNAIWSQVKFFIDTDKPTTLHDRSRQENRLHFKTLDASIIKLINKTPILKIKIFNLQGRTVYSTDEKEVGQIMPKDYPGKYAATSGKALTKLNFYSHIKTINSVLSDRYILSSYLPIRDPANNEIRAVFEIHADISETYQKIIDSRNKFALTVIIILALVYTALFLLVRHADLIIRKQANEREQYLREIESINLDLDSNAKDLAKAHDKAVEASTYKSQFLANMSHELRTPLNAIIGYSEMLAEDMEDSGLTQVIDDLNKIQGAGKHLLLVINEILDISKIEAGHIIMHLEDFDVHNVIQDIATAAEPLALKGNNRFTLICPDDIGIIYSDVTRFRQIMLNLLSNACKFTKNGDITLTINRETNDENAYIVCTITDTGIGISQENLEKIFKPFQQADSSTTREHGGTGLGLTISKRFCIMLGGTIRAESKLKSGTQFIVKLPVKAKNTPVSNQENTETPISSEAHTTKQQRNHKQLKKINRILFVADKSTSRNFYRLFLEKHGFDVTIAETAAQCLSLAQQAHPDMIALDITLPDKDGWSLLQELKQDPQLRDIPVIMLSTISEKNMSSLMGTHNYLKTPIDWEHVAGVIRKWLRLEKSVK